MGNPFSMLVPVYNDGPTMNSKGQPHSHGACCWNDRTVETGFRTRRIPTGTPAVMIRWPGNQPLLSGLASKIRLT
ncbi:MAG: hypothetical protein IPK53_20560 [bacterium]|nr:hypothetical protein [bacterium]